MVKCDVFISYGHNDLLRIEPVVTRLEAEGFKVFLDRKLALSSAWVREIDTHLEAAACVLVFWSKTSVKSSNVEAEAIKGFNRGVLASIII